MEPTNATKSSMISTLRQLCTDPLGRNIAALIENEITSYVNNSYSAFEDVILKARAHGAAFRFDALPLEALKDVFQNIKNISEEALFVLAAPFGAQIDSITFSSQGSRLARTLFIPWCSVACAGLKSIHFGSFKLADNMFSALAHSQVASSLTTIRASSFQTQLSNRSAKLWAKFTALRKVEISELAPVSMENILALSRLSTLESLSLCSHHDWIDVVQVLLAPTSLPSIQSLRITSNSEESWDSLLNEFHAILLARPVEIRNRLVRFPLPKEFFESLPNDLEPLVQIQHLCPELDLSPQVLRNSRRFVANADRIPVELLRNISGYSMSDQSMGDSFDVESENAAFQKIVSSASMSLESLSIEYARLTDKSWSMLTRLSTLHTLKCWSPVINVRHFLSIAPSILPSTLKSLDLSLDSDHSEAQIEHFAEMQTLLDQFVGALCSSNQLCNNLTVLRLDLGNCDITPEHITSLLANLHQLTSLDIRLYPTLTFGSAVVPLSHPSLKEWPLLSMVGYCRYEPVSLPALKRIKDNVDSLCELSPSIAPQLDSIEIEFKLWPTKKIKSIVAALRRFKASLRNLNLQSSAAARCDLNSILPHMHQLRSIVLCAATLSDSLCSSILSNCRWLSTMSLTNCSGLQSLTWLKHPVLSEFRLLESPLGSGAAEIRLDATALPNLGSLLIHPRSVNHASVWISGLQQLADVSISTLGPDNVPVYIADCPALEEILLSIAFGALALIKCRSLKKVCLHYCSRLQRVMNEAKVHIHENGAFEWDLLGTTLPEEWSTAVQTNQENLKRIQELFIK